MAPPSGLSIDGARALVVGATGGLGSAITERLVAGGARVVTSGRRELAGVGATVHVQADLTVSSDRERIIDDALGALGGLDLVVIAAGVVGFGPASVLRAGDIATLLAVDLAAPLALIGEVAPAVEDGGTIAVLTGAIVDTPIPGTSTYTAAKAGLSAACGVLRRELRSRRVNVLDARPPHTETGLADRAIFGAAPRFPTGLTPEAVAECMVRGVADGESELPPSAFGTP